MKITKRQLRRIIKEEKAKVLKEQARPDRDTAMEILNMSLGSGLTEAEILDYILFNWMSGDDAGQSMTDWWVDEMNQEIGKIPRG